MTEKLESTRIAYWLLPGAEDGEPLQALIAELARRFGTPLFPPHITLQVVPIEAAGEPTTILDNLCADNQPLTLEYTTPPHWSPVYNQALALPIVMTDQLSQMVVALNPLQQLPPNYQPHISLLYGHIEQATAAELIREITLNPQPILFNRISAVLVGPKTDCDDDVRNWQVVATREIRQKES